MAEVIVTKQLEKEINRNFKNESIEIFKLMNSLEENPKKGKIVGIIGKILIKEIKYKSYRFYFVLDGYKIKMLKASELKDLIIKFVRMSNKKNQQKTINEIKYILKSLGEENF